MILLLIYFDLLKLCHYHCLIIVMSVMGGVFMAVGKLWLGWLINEEGLFNCVVLIMLFMSGGKFVN